jgi:protein TIF31
MQDKIDASSKLDIKLDGSQAPGMSSDELAQRNLLKGITADESATIHVRLPPCNFHTNTSISIL